MAEDAAEYVAALEAMAREAERAAEAQERLVAELDRLTGCFIEFLLPVLHKASTRKQEIILNIRGFDKSEALGSIQGFRKFIVFLVILDDEPQHVGIVREIV